MFYLKYFSRSEMFSVTGFILYDVNQNFPYIYIEVRGPASVSHMENGTQVSIFGYILFQFIWNIMFYFKFLILKESFSSTIFCIVRIASLLV